MPATTTLLGLVTPTQGTLSGTWGDTVNYGISDYVDISVAGTLTLTNDGAVTLANTTGSSSGNSITSSLTGAGTVTAQFAIVKVTGTLTVAKVVTGPSYSKTYTVVNSATGGIVTFKASGQTGVSIAVGETAFVYFNGTDYVKIVGTATAGAAGGSTTQVQYNNAGVLAGITGATSNGTALTLVAPILGTPASATLTNATGLPIGTGVSGLGTGVATFLATPSSANLAAALTDETGSGANVFATSPTLVTPVLGTPTSGVATNLTGLPISTGVSGLGTGIATALAVNTGSAGAPVLFNGALGTPSSGTVTNLTGTASININGTVGATTASSGAFTTLSSTGATTLANSGVTFPLIASINRPLTISAGTGSTSPSITWGSSSSAALQFGDSIAVGYQSGGVQGRVRVQGDTATIPGFNIAEANSDVYLVTNRSGSAFNGIPNNYYGLASNVNLPFALSINGSKVLDVTSTGLAVVGLVDISAATSGQIKFPATQNASSDANTLDDYEEGTWTGTWSSVTAPTTPCTATGTYTKIGRVVTVSIFFEGVDTTGGSGRMFVLGLPFSVAATVGSRGGAAVQFYGILFVGNYAAAEAVNTEISFRSITSNAAWADISMTAGATKYLQTTTTYIV